MKKREEVIQLIKEGISISQIARRLNMAKSTIHYHYSKIKGRKYPKTTIPKDDKIVGEFLGIFAGDGSYYFDKKRYDYVIQIHLNLIDDRLYADYIKELIQTKFNRRVSEYRKLPKLLSLKFHSKDLYLLIKEYLDITPIKTFNISIKKDINKLSKEFLIRFLRGLFDTDGCFKKDGRIVLCLISKNMITQTSFILNKLEIDNKVYPRNKKLPEKPQYELIIPRREVQKYMDLISSSNPIKIRSALAEARNPG